MPRQIVVEIPDEVPERVYAELAAAISSVAEAVGKAADPAFPVAVHHDFQGRVPAAHRPGQRLAHYVPEPPAGFTVVLRGYDRAQVDEWISQVQRSAPPYPRPSFNVALRGYDRAQVDAWVRQVADAQ
jgi:DivIVA domain-containing protein